MGKHIYVRLEEDSDPGCVWGFLQILGYHQWRGIKGILQRRKKGKRKSNRSNAKLKQTKQIGAQQEFSEPEPNSISVKWGNPKTGSMSTKQVKSSIKALIAEEISKDDDSKCRVSGSPEQSPLKTVHAKPSFHGFEDRSAEWRGLALLLKNGMDISTPKLQDLHLLKAQETPVPSDEEPPLEKSGKSRGKLSNQMLANYGKHRRCLTQIGLKDNIDFLELLKANKELFLEILHDPDAALASELFSRSEDRQKTARLIKSGSFPSANSSHNRFSTPSKLEHKHTEIWPVVKGKKLLPTPEDNEDTNTNNGIRNFKLQSIRKSSSLTESMDKYAQLFSYNFDKETTRQLSRSLKLTNEKDFASADNYVPKSFRRRLSMPELEYSYSLHPKEASGDAFPSGMLINKEVSLRDMNGVSHDEAKGFCVSMKEPLIPNSKDVRSPKGLVLATDDIPDVEGSTSFMQSCHEKEQELKIAATGDFGARKNTGSAPEICSQSTEMDSNEFPFSEGSHPKTSVPQFDYLDIEINLHSSNLADSESTGSSCIEVVNNLNILDDPWHSGHIIKRDEKYDAEFKYVKFVLELSGLTREGQLETQHLLEQPLDTALFEEAEAGCPLEQKLSMGEVASSNCQRNLLFGLVDEAMLSIFERSSAYYPKTLSFSCQIHPVPTGNRVLEEVWAFVSRRLRWNLEQGLPLDGAVAQDLWKNDGWMNLQFESECIALQLEHLIFNELLEEAICFA